MMNNAAAVTHPSLIRGENAYLSPQEKLTPHSGRKPCVVTNGPMTASGETRHPLLVEPRTLNSPGCAR